MGFFLIVDRCNTCFHHFFGFLSCVKERKIVIYEVGLTIFLRAFDLFFRISLSFLGLLDLMSLSVDGRQWMCGWHHEFLLRGKARDFSKSDRHSIESGIYEKLLWRISLMIGCCWVETLHFFRDVSWIECRWLYEKIKWWHGLVFIFNISLLFFSRINIWILSCWHNARLKTNPPKLEIFIRYQNIFWFIWNMI